MVQRSRKFIKAVGAGALATGIGANIMIPQRARAAQKTLKILQWVHFVPAYDEWFNETYVKEWGEKNDTEVIVDNIHNVGIPARAEAEVITLANDVIYGLAATMWTRDVGRAIRVADEG